MPWLLLWLYVTVGLLGVVGSVIKDPKEWLHTDLGNDADAGDRIVMAVLYIVMWPLGLVFFIVDSVGNAIKAISEARTNTAAAKEVVRLREENEALKDRLYELEP